MIMKEYYSALSHILFMLRADLLLFIPFKTLRIYVITSRYINFQKVLGNFNWHYQDIISLFIVNWYLVVLPL